MVQIYHHIGGGIAGERPVGGGAYSMLLQSNSRKAIVEKTTAPSAKVEKIKNKLYKDCKGWEQLLDIYNLTSDEYFEIAKWMVNWYSLEWVCRYLRVDKLSANQYYEICKIMAVNGDFYNVDCRKLFQAKPEGVRNPLYQIMMTALVKSVFGYYSKEAFIAPMILCAIRENTDCFEPNEKAALFFALWVFMKPRYDDINISCDDLVGITEHTVKYVKNIIIREIYKAPNSDFVKRLNFPSVMCSEDNGMPKIVTDACGEIVKEIHKAGQERMAMKHNRRVHYH